MVILTLIHDFVAVRVGLCFGLIKAEGAKGEGGAEGGGGCGVGGVLAGDFAGHVEGLEGPDAELAPDGDGHATEGVGLFLIGGVVVGNEAVEKGAEARLGFAGDDDGFGEHAVGNLE